MNDIKLKDSQRNVSTIDLNKCDYREVLNFTDYRGFNHLMIAAANGNLETLDRLLKSGFDVNLNIDGETAASLAWKNNHPEALLLLLNANSLFPVGVNSDVENQFLRNFIGTTDNFHDLIKKGNVKVIEQFLKHRDDNLRHFYDRRNVSAPALALKLKRFDVYDTLLTYNITIGPKEDLNVIMVNLVEEDKKKLRKIHFNHKKELFEQHLMTLTSSSYVCHDNIDASAKHVFITQAFMFLNQILIIQPILKICAASKNLHIIFDLNRDTIQHADPSSDSETRGMFYTTKQIYIGAKKLLCGSTAVEVYATLAHELGHFAMLLVFRNDCKPFDINDEISKRLFIAVVNHCRARRFQQELIDLVFKYPGSQQKAELIVRAPHIQVLYFNNPRALMTLREIYAPLFEYYERTVLPKIVSATPQVEHIGDVEVKRFAHKVEKQNSYLKHAIFIVAALMLALTSAVYVSMKPEPVYVYGNLTETKKLQVESSWVNFQGESVILGEIAGKDVEIYDLLTTHDIREILNGDLINISSIVDTGNKFYFEREFEEIDGKVGNSKELDHFEKSDEKPENPDEKLENPESPDDNLENDVEIPENSESSKKSAENLENRDEKPENPESLDENLESPENFVENPENSNSFKESGKNLENPDENPENFKSSVENLENTESPVENPQIVKVSRSSILGPSHEMYAFDSSKIKNSTEISRKTSKSFDNLLKELKTKKIFLISDEPGAGKTTTLKKLAQQLKKEFHHKWIQFIDLKSHIVGFKKINGNENFILENFTLKNISTFFSDEILKLPKIEAKIFTKRFNEDQVIFLFDAVDEISPNYNSLIINIILKVRETTNNTQLISTRPHIAKILENRLKIQSYKLSKLTKQDRIEYIHSFLSTSNQNESIITEMTTKIESFIQTLELRPEKRKFSVNNPLMLNMIVELQNGTTNPVNFTNYYEIYDEFMSKKIEIAQKKGEIAFNNINTVLKLDTTMNINKIHQRYGIKAILGEYFYTLNSTKINTTELQIMKEEIQMSNEEISRFGILTIHGADDFTFVHRTFAEFFIAEYVINNIYNATGSMDENEVILRTIFLFHFFTGLNDKFSAAQRFIIDYIELNENLNTFYFKKTSKQDVFAEKIKEFYTLQSKSFVIPHKTFEFISNFFRKDRNLLNLFWKFNTTESHNLNHYFAENYDIDEVQRMKDFTLKYFTHDEVKENSKLVDNYLSILTHIWYYEQIMKTNYEQSRDDDQSRDDEQSRSMQRYTEIFLNATEIQLTDEEFSKIKAASTFPKFFVILNNITSDSQILKDFFIKNAFEIILSWQTYDEFEETYKIFDESFRLFDKTLKILNKTLNICDDEVFLPEFIINFLPMRNSDYFSKFLLRIKENCNENQIEKILFYKRESNNFTPLLIGGWKASSVKTLEIFWNFTKENLNHSKIREILLAEGINHEKPLHMSVFNPHSGIFKFMKEIYYKTFTKDETFNKETFNKETFNKEEIFNKQKTFNKEETFKEDREEIRGFACENSKNFWRFLRFRGSDETSNDIAQFILEIFAEHTEDLKALMKDKKRGDFAAYKLYKDSEFKVLHNLTKTIFPQNEWKDVFIDDLAKNFSDN